MLVATLANYEMVTSFLLSLKNLRYIVQRLKTRKDSLQTE